MPSNVPMGLADEENDPDRPNPTTPRPTFTPEVVSSVCFIFSGAPAEPHNDRGKLKPMN